jgi:NAD(P)-dependent dehydrogenase (short-subunit alcohol dehydrogenase family)
MRSRFFPGKATTKRILHAAALAVSSPAQDLTYAPSKGAVNQLTRSPAVEYGGWIAA